MMTERRVWVEKAAKILSVLFHPIFVPLYGLLLIYNIPTLLSYMPENLKRIILVLVVADNIVLPLSIAALLYTRGAIKTIEAKERNERILLLTFCLLMYGITAFMMMKLPVASLFKAYFLSVAIVTLLTLVINIFFRISLHAVGIGGLIALAVSLMLIFNIVSVVYLVVLALVSGAVLSSRLYLDEHKPAEVWLGLLTGAVVTGVSLVLFFR